MLRVRLEDVVVPICTAWGLPIRKFSIQSHGLVLVVSQGSLLDDTVVFNAKL